MLDTHSIIGYDKYIKRNGANEMTSTQTSELDKFLNPEDYVFGSSNKYYNVAENKMVISKPRYVRYTLESLKKRSTKRLETMHFNLYGKVSDRYTMISNLYNKLNQMWNMYNTETSTLKIDKFGFQYWQGSEPAKKSVGRPAVFETEQQVTKLYVEYLNGATLN